MKKVPKNTGNSTPHVEIEKEVEAIPLEEPKNYYSLTITGDGESVNADFITKGFNAFEIIGLLSAELAKHHAAILLQTQKKEVAG